MLSDCETSNSEDVECCSAILEFKQQQYYYLEITIHKAPSNRHIARFFKKVTGNILLDSFQYFTYSSVLHSHNVLMK